MVLTKVSSGYKGELFIHSPRVELFGGKIRLVAFVDAPIPYGSSEVFIEVSKSYGEYLCYERSDAFLVCFLRFAMSNGLDIRCEAPVGEEILYNLRTYLIPSLSDHCHDLYATKIFATVDSCELPNLGAVGTGASLGIDSMHSILHHLNSGYKGHNLTHLVLNNVGAYEPNRGAGQFEWKCARARDFAAEVGLELVEINSNLASLFGWWNCHFFDLTNTYVNASTVLALQKFWRTYYYSSWGHDFSYFSLCHINDHDSACYDLLSLNAFSSRQLRFHPEGGAKSRVSKTRDVASFPLAHKYLHVCTDDRGPNCMKCSKCKRTLVTLDALEVLDAFKDVFDVEYYRAHRSDYLRWLVKEELRHGHDTYTGEAYKILKTRHADRGGIPISDSAFAHIVVGLEKILPTHAIIPMLKLKRAFSFNKRES